MREKSGDRDEKCDMKFQDYYSYQFHIEFIYKFIRNPHQKRWSFECALAHPNFIIAGLQKKHASAQLCHTVSHT